MPLFSADLGEYEGDLNIDERIVTDLIGACRTVVEKVDLLPSRKDRGHYTSDRREK